MYIYICTLYLQCNIWCLGVLFGAGWRSCTELLQTEPEHVCLSPVSCSQNRYASPMPRVYACLWWWWGGGFSAVCTSRLGPVGSSLHSAVLRYRKLQLRFCAGPDLDRLSARILTFLSEPWSLFHLFHGGMEMVSQRFVSVYQLTEHACRQRTGFLHAKKPEDSATAHCGTPDTNTFQYCWI